MGFKIEINSIVRTDIIPENLKVGSVHEFTNDKSRVYFDDIPIWLVRKDWTAVAEIQIVNQARSEGEFEKAKYKVLYIYSEKESKAITEIFKRMYGWE